MNLKILFVIPKSQNPGAMSFVLRLKDALIAQGAQVETFFVQASFLPWQFLKQGLAIGRAAKAGRFDLVNAQYGTYTGLITTLFTLHLRIPTLVTFRGSDLNPVPSEKRLKRVLQHLFSQFSGFLADGVICVSREVYSRLWAKKPFSIIPSSTDVEKFAPTDQALCRERLGWPKDQATALFLSGSNEKIKRADLAREVQGKLCSRKSSVELKILEYVDSSQLPLYLNAADALLFLSDFEGSPNIIREACACNLPIVSVDVGDVREVLASVSNCQIVSRDLNEITQAIENQTLLRTRSNGRAAALSFANEATAQKTLCFYKKVVPTFWQDRERMHYDTKAEEAAKSRNLAISGSLAMPYWAREPFLFLDEMLAKSLPGKTLLDFGCGDGIHSIAAAKFGARVTGADISGKSLELAEKRRILAGLTPSQVVYQTADITSLPLPANHFDCVLSVGTLSSVPFNEGLKEISRVLKADGILLGIDTLKGNPFALGSRYLKYLMGKRTANTLAGVFGAQTLAQLREGFEEVEFHYFQLFSLAGRAFREGSGMTRRLRDLDHFLFRVFPVLRLLAFKVVFLCRRPRRACFPLPDHGKCH